MIRRLREWRVKRRRARILTLMARETRSASDRFVGTR